MTKRAKPAHAGNLAWTRLRIGNGSARGGGRVGRKVQRTAQGLRLRRRLDAGDGLQGLAAPLADRARLCVLAEGEVRLQQPAVEVLSELVHLQAPVEQGNRGRVPAALLE